MRSSILTLILSLQAFAICPLINKPQNELVLLTNLLSEFTKKPWAAASEDQIKSAICKKKYPSLNQMKKYLASKPTITSNLDMLLNKPKGLLDKSGITTDLMAYDISSCKEKPICISQKVFGESEGIELLYLHTKYGLNGSHLVYPDAIPWTSKGLKKYTKALMRLPDSMLPIKENHKFIKSKMKTTNVADASISFYSGIADFSDAKLEYTVFHELAHYITGERHTENDPKWMIASHWEEDNLKANLIRSKYSKPMTVKPLQLSVKAPSLSLGKKPSSNRFFIQSSTTKETGPSFMQRTNDKIMEIQILAEAMKNNKPETLISGYSEVNPLEDIAESVVAYRYNPQKLLEISPQKYMYIKEHIFKGVEYTSEKKCQEHK